MGKLIGNLAVFAALVAAAVWFSSPGAKDTPPAAPPGQAHQRAYDAGLALEAQWKQAQADKSVMPPGPYEVDRIDRQIGEIPLDWPQAEAAIDLVKRLRAERPAIEKAYRVADEARRQRDLAAREKNLLAERRAYPTQAEEAFLDEGKDVYLTVEGKDARRLKVKYVLMGRPMAHQIGKNTTLISRWRELGFTEVVLTDGYRESWKLDLR